MKNIGWGTIVAVVAACTVDSSGRQYGTAGEGARSGAGAQSGAGARSGEGAGAQSGEGARTAVGGGVAKASGGASEAGEGALSGDAPCPGEHVFDSDLRACRGIKTCADVECSGTFVCVPQTATEDARCRSTSCPAGHGWDSTSAQCRRCADEVSPRCESAGETGAVLLLEPEDDSICACETRPGYYISRDGSAAVPCDADADGWVSDDAQPSIEGSNDVLRANSRCDVRRIASIVLQSEAGVSLVAEDFSSKFGDADLGIPSGLPLYESARNDNGPSNSSIPSYGGETLNPRTVNSLTKYCGAADYNDNGVTDVSEWSEAAINLGASRPSEHLALYYSEYARFSYFAELNNGWYEAADGATPASYWIAERLRTASDSQGIGLAYPAIITAGLDPAEINQCVRHIDTHFKWTAPSGAPPTLASPNTKGGDFAEFGDVAWPGMTHHSQFKCVQVEDADTYASLSLNDETAPEVLFAIDRTLHRRTAKGQDDLVPWYPNDCAPTGGSDSPGKPPRSAVNTFTCKASESMPEPGAVVWAAVGFQNANQTTPYKDFTAPGSYKRGCRNECAELPIGAPAGNGCATCKPAKFGQATPVSVSPDAGKSCDSCGGTYKCDGTCAKKEPAEYGQACQDCGGTIQCDNTCSKPNPPNLNQPCGKCGGQYTCNGSCSVPTPANLGQPCGNCGGQYTCDGSCSVPTPANFGEACGAAGCNGRRQCNGSCSISDAARKPCGHCGGTYECDGSTCSKSTPQDYGAVHEISQLKSSGFCCGGSTGSTPGIDQSDPTFFDGACPAGYVREGDPWTTRDNNKGHCEGKWEEPLNNRSCTVRVHMGATFAEGNVSCRVHINLKRVCD